MECTGLLCCGVRWTSQYRWKKWKITTRELNTVADKISPDKLMPGDILGKAGKHVIIVVQKEGETVDIIEAKGKKDANNPYGMVFNKVRFLTKQKLKEIFLENKFIPMRLKIDNTSK